MGDYSIAKSFKGILRIGHIMQYNSSEKDELFNPYYYGKPTSLLDISGGAYKSKEFGYPNPITGMSGTCNRYTSENTSINDDALKLLRVPMTDSMGNYLNWNVGLDGVTIGSCDEINGNKVQYEYFTQENSKNKIVQEKFFPIVNSLGVLVGLKNKLPYQTKFSIKQAQVDIESSLYGDDAILIIENKFDKTDKNTKPIQKFVLDSDGKITGQKQISSWKSFDKPASYYNSLQDQTGSEYSKVRTIYHASKPTVQDFDVFMYRQDDYDVENWAGNEISQAENVYTSHLGEDFKPNEEGELLDCHVDIVNLRSYVKDKIKDYLNGNVVEVPSGAIIWQYCSLDKWYARKINPESVQSKDFPGNRPAMNLRAKSDSEKFFSSLIQGACRKSNHLINESKAEITSKEESKQDDNVQMYDDDSILDELIPLYKRDYVLCDGSLYRIPYRPPFNNANISTQREVFDRFINLLFAIGYKYTNRKWIAARTDFRIDETGKAILQCKFPTNAQTDSRDISIQDFDNISPTKSKELYLSLTDTFSPTNWIGNVPNLVDVEQSLGEDPWKYLDDYDVLFGMDLATMIVCDIIFAEYNSDNMFKINGSWQMEDEQGNLVTINADKFLDMKIHQRFAVIEHWIKDKAIPQKYIFNTFVTDSQSKVQEYYKNTYGNEQCPIKVLSLPYYNFVEQNENTSDIKDFSNYPIIHMGCQVNNTNSWIKIYDHNDKNYKTIKLWQLPNVQMFMMCLSTKHRIEDSINKFCYMYFNYNFQVPCFISEDKSPVYIGSGAIRWSDPRNRELIKVETWSSNFTSTSMPHRHALFCSPLQGFNHKNAIEMFKGDSISGTMPVSGSACLGGNPQENETRVDGQGSYIVNEIICEWDSTKTEDAEGNIETSYNAQDIFGTRSKILQIPKQISETEADISFDNLVTGNFRNNISIFTDDDWKKMENEFGITEKPEDMSWDDVSPQNATSLDKYYQYEVPYWYSFRLKDDPRFDTGEPNRGITSQPTNVYTYKNIKEDKLTINQNNFGKGNGGNTTGSFFSGENIKMIPLIKI